MKLKSVLLDLVVYGISGLLLWYGASNLSPIELAVSYVIGLLTGRLIVLYLENKKEIQS